MTSVSSTSESAARRPEGAAPRRARLALLAAFGAWLSVGALLAVLGPRRAAEYAAQGVVLPLPTEWTLALARALADAIGWIPWVLPPLIGAACHRAGGDPALLRRSAWLAVALSGAALLLLLGALDLPLAEPSPRLHWQRPPRGELAGPLFHTGKLAVGVSGLLLLLTWARLAAGLLRRPPGPAGLEAWRALAVGGPPGLLAAGVAALLAPAQASGFVLLRAPPGWAAALTAFGLVWGAALAMRLRRPAPEPAPPT